MTFHLKSKGSLYFKEPRFISYDPRRGVSPETFGVTYSDNTQKWVHGDYTLSP